MPHNEHALHLIAQLLTDKTGIYFARDNHSTLRHRVGTLCRQYGLISIAEFYGLLGSRDPKGKKALGDLVREVTINHTMFFREERAIREVLSAVLPLLRDETEVRVWSAASATGEELYTLIMMLAEELGMATLSNKWRFLGTDINGDVVAHAENGVYPKARILKVPRDLRERYFEPQLDAFRVRDEVRRLATFRRMNLTTAPYPFTRRFHLIYLRNVLYYFDETTQERVLRSIHGVTRHNGYLVTSVSESIQSLNTPWHRVMPFIHRSSPVSSAETPEKH